MVSSRVIAQRDPGELIEHRDDHTRVWEIEKEVETTHPDGSKTIETLKSHIHEKGSGLCYRDASGKFVPSVAEWRETPDGFVVDRCGYWLSVSKTIGSGLRYIVEGHELLLRAAYLMISDGPKEAHLAVLNPNATGFIVPGSPSVVRFPQAFGPGYDLEYVAEKGGFHQNLVIAAPPKLPDGFDPDKTAVYLYTEMNLDQYLAASGLKVLVEGEEIAAAAADLLSPVSRGGCISSCRPPEVPGEPERTVHAFSISSVAGSPGGGTLPKETLAEKRILKEGSTHAAYLVESLPFSYFVEDTAPAYPVVWDYQNIYEPISGGTWEPRYTYRVSGNIYIEGTLTILPGTTVKLDPSKKISIVSGGKVVAKGEPYNYVTFTNSSDSNCGETIPGAPAGRWDRVFDIQNASSPDSAIRYCKFGHGYTGIDLRQTLNQSIAHNIFYDMLYYGMHIQYCSATVHNNLMVSCSGNNMYAHGTGGRSFTNNTVEDTYCGICDQGSYSFKATDNLVSNTRYQSGYGTGISTDNPSGQIHHNRFYRVQTPVSGGNGYNNVVLGTSPYKYCGVGAFFLDPENVDVQDWLIDNGSDTASAIGLADEVFTVFAPEVSGASHEPQETWARVGTDAPDSPVDIGYHHNRIDRYVSDICTFSGSGSYVVVEPGVAVGIRADKYLLITNEARLVSVGDPGLVSSGAPSRWRYNLFTNSKSLSMNIESSKFGDYGANPFVYLADASPESRIVFTRTMWLGFGVMVVPRLDEPIRDSVFSLSWQGLHVGTVGNVLINNLAHENVFGAYAGGNAQVANCTFDRNTTGLKVYAFAGETLHIRDSLFTKNSGQGIQIDAGTGKVLNYYNGFWDNGTPITGGSPGNGCVFLYAPYWSGIEDPWHVRYRLKQYSAAVNGGCARAADAGLAAYTTASDARYDVQEVDMGFHFLARPTVWADVHYTGADSDGSRLRPYGVGPSGFDWPISGALSSSRAVEGTTVLVLPGRYLYNLGGGVGLAMDGVHLIGSGRDVTILDAQASKGGSLVYIEGTESTTLADITLAAVAIMGRNNEWDDNKGYGGGIKCYKATGVQIRDCLIDDNDADYGGGLYIENAQVTVEDCIIHQNTANSGLAGGGVYIKWCGSSNGRKVTIRRSTVSNNTAGDPDQLLDARGGAGVYCCNPPGGPSTATDPLIEDCVISHNRATVYHGGGLSLDENCPATIRNCIIEYNMATHLDGLYSGRGGGIYLYNSSPTISGCTISNNTSVTGGSGINCAGDPSYPAIVNCTVVYNGPAGGTAGIFNDFAHLTVVNCIIWGNGDDLHCCGATYSCIEDGDSGEGNTDDNPFLVGSVYGPYHLGYPTLPGEFNPCIDTGTTDPAKLPPGYVIPGYDIDGDTRVMGANIDMGSDERHPFREVISIRKDYALDKVIIKWASESGRTYKVYSGPGLLPGLSTDAFSNYMVWTHRADVQATGATTSWEDTGINFQSPGQRYYKVKDNNGTYSGLFTRPVGFVTAKVDDIDPSNNYQSTFFAVPLELKYEAINAVQGAENESLGSMISEELNQEGDTIEFLKLGCPDETQQWTYLQLRWVSGIKKWFTTDTTPVESKERFGLGEVFRIAQTTASPATITLLGSVPSRPFRPMVFLSSRSEKHVEFGYPYPVSTTLNAIPFAQYGAIPDGGDEVWIPTGPAEENWKKLHLGTNPDGTPEWKDGEDPATSPDIDVVPGKGFRYYGWQKSGPGYNPEWRVYYMRVPVSRPYRTE